MKTCPICETQFEPRRPLQKVCNLVCALEDSKRKRSKREQKVARKARLDYKEENMSLAVRARETQKAFNKYIRIRDRGKPCISCGIMSGQFHAGHYRTTKSTPELRYNVLACHGQCAQCNNYKSGNQIEYRAGLMDRIGAYRTEVLDLTNHQPHYSHEYLKRLARIFKAKAKLYERLFR